MNLPDVVSYVRTCIARGKTEDALDCLVEEGANLFPGFMDQLVLLRGRFASAEMYRNTGQLNIIEFDRIVQEINLVIVDILRDLENHLHNPRGNPEGHLLYSIPGRMKIGRIDQCFVRIAREIAKIRENLPDSAVNVVVQKVEIGDVMGVDLQDREQEPAFKISRATGYERPITDAAYTEWAFDVSPLRSGRYPLFLKISIIKKIGEDEYFDNVVLEKEVIITAQALEESAPTESMRPTPSFESANMAINYGYTYVLKEEIKEAAVIMPSAVPPSPAPTPPVQQPSRQKAAPAKTTFPWGKVMAVLLFFGLAGFYFVRTSNSFSETSSGSGATADVIVEPPPPPPDPSVAETEIIEETSGTELADNKSTSDKTAKDEKPKSSTAEQAKPAYPSSSVLVDQSAMLYSIQLLPPNFQNGRKRPIPAIKDVRFNGKSVSLMRTPKTGYSMQISTNVSNGNLDVLYENGEKCSMPLIFPKEKPDGMSYTLCTVPVDLEFELTTEGWDLGGRNQPRVLIDGKAVPAVSIVDKKIRFKFNSSELSDECGILVFTPKQRCGTRIKLDQRLKYSITNCIPN